MQEDLDFISGKFFDFDVPKERRYLLKYFTTDLQVAFLRYFFVFGKWKNFKDHTGYHCSRFACMKLEKRYWALIKAYDEAKAEFTEGSLEALGAIESGKYRY